MEQHSVPLLWARGNKKASRTQECMTGMTDSSCNMHCFSLTKSKQTKLEISAFLIKHS